MDFFNVNQEQIKKNEESEESEEEEEDEVDPNEDLFFKN
jgi:hypothetical protein